MCDSTLEFNWKTRLNRTQQIFTAIQWRQLLKNSETRPSNAKPVVKFFDPQGAATWLLTECDKEGYAFGLCDLGMGFPELGSVYLPEIAAIGRIERDLYFHPNKTLKEYTDEARALQKINA